MPVDMLLSRFFGELDKALPRGERPFRREGDNDDAINVSRLPPYRHIFHALCLFEHSCGYRLPRYVQFKKTYVKALKEHPRYAEERKSLLDADGKPVPGLLHRIGGWYLDGLAHTHLYCALVQAYEEQRRIGAVLMDARVDVKLKADIIIAAPGGLVRVDIQNRTGQEQQALLQSRRDREREAKAKNSSSSQEENPLHETIRTVFIQRSACKLDKRYGVKLFGAEAIDPLIRDIDACLGVPPEGGLGYADMAGVSMQQLQTMSREGRIPRYDGARPALAPLRGETPVGVLGPEAAVGTRDGIVEPGLKR